MKKKVQKIDTATLLNNLPTSNSAEDKHKRKKIFDSIDNNGNGYLSLAEIDKGIRDVLKLNDVFDCKPVIMRAFQAAKDSVDTGSKFGQDYVERSEFRYLLCYLRQYFSYYQIFQEMDKEHDGKISFQEFKASEAVMNSHGLFFENLKDEFNLIDTNGGGSILFDEFVHYCISKSLAKDNDHHNQS